MLVASHGARAARGASNFVPHSSVGVPGARRNIHIPSFARIHPRIPQLGKAQKIFSHSRNLLAQFFAHLTAPGLRVPTSPPLTRSLYNAARSHHTIQQGFSLPLRNALSRPLQSHILPHAPAAVPRTVTQVGLGTARNFSSGRPIFQNLVENVPVAGRAFYEADWELKMRQEREMMRKPYKMSPKKALGKELLKPKSETIVLKEVTPSQQSVVEAELDQYFQAPATPDVTTYLLIPLAPTPTTRVPLPRSPTTDTTLLPLHTLASIHTSYETHSLRVSSLFSRLDAANVWERDVQCSAFSHGGGHEGVCTMLKVEFVGWTKAEVRSVLGESGTGWCILEEKETSDQRWTLDEDDDLLSDTSSLSSGHEYPNSRIDLTNVGVEIDPAQSFVLPTLDFSSSFLASSDPSLSSSRTSSFDLFSDTSSDSDFDPWLDAEPSDNGFIGTGNWVEPPSQNGWFGFSSQFSGRAEMGVLHHENIFY